MTSGSREWPSEDKHAAFHDRKTAKDQRYDTEDLLAVLTPAVRLFCKRMDGYRMRSTNQNPQALSHCTGLKRYNVSESSELLDSRKTSVCSDLFQASKLPHSPFGAAKLEEDRSLWLTRS